MLWKDWTLEVRVELLYLEKNNNETDKLWIIWLDRPNCIVLNCTHSYCNECIQEWKQFHKSWPLCRYSVAGNFNQEQCEDNLGESTKYELIDIPKDSSQEMEIDKIMKKKLKNCLKFLKRVD